MTTTAVFWPSSRTLRAERRTRRRPAGLVPPGRGLGQDVALQLQPLPAGKHPGRAGRHQGAQRRRRRPAGGHRRVRGPAVPWRPPHGASVHHELQHLVRAGLTPVQALRAATATTARRFRLTDRGRIAEGLRADLLLVDGDPTTTISDTLNTRAVWRRGTRLTT
ncbi:MAG: amidohydrolase family protein [Umezawaea sp.]